MANCDDCSGPYVATQKSRVKCASHSCLKWTHKSCANILQTTIAGYWYCKLHKKEILPALRRKENSETEVELEDNATELDEHLEKVSEKDKNENNEHEEINNETLKTRSKDSNPNNEDPFANFNCETCGDPFSNESKGAVCRECNNTYHISCLNEIELESVRNFKFCCQHCIQDRIRRKNLKGKQRINKKLAKSLLSSNESFVSIPNITQVHKASTVKSKKSVRSSLRRKSNIIAISSSSSSSESNVESSDEDDAQKFAQYMKLRKIFRNKKSYKVSASESADESDDSIKSGDLSKKDTILSLFKFTQEEREKARYEKLPIVEFADTKWSVFYDLFKKSRKLFSDSENILRIQKSIKSKEIREMSGNSLFDPRTYWQAIKLINKRLCQSYNLLHKETNEIIKLKKLKFDYEHKKIVEFINKIENYSFIVDSYGIEKHKVDDRVISHIANIMPNSLANGWHKYKSKIEDQKKSVCISHIAEYLSKQIPYLNSKIQAEETDPWKEFNQNKFHKKYDSQNKRTSNSNYFNKSENTSQELNFCWLHKSKSHSAFECSKLWNMTGKEVCDLARKNNICTFCGFKRQKDCHSKSNLNCKIEGCKFKHHILFCYKRKARSDKNNENSEKSNNHKKNNNKDSNKKNQNSPEESNRSSRSPKQNSLHHQDDRKESEIDIKFDNGEIEIPQSHLYLNKPPKSFKIKTFNEKSNNAYTESSNFNNYHLRCELIDNVSHNIKLNRTNSCTLAVVVINFVEQNEFLAFLLDTGSTVSLFDENVANRLDIKGLWNPLKLNWSSNISRIDYGSRIIKVAVSSTCSKAKTFDLFFRTVKDLNMHDQPFDVDEIIQLYPHLRQLNLSSYSKISGIIGIDNLWCFDQYKVFKPRNWTPKIPYGIRGPLGDYVIGNVNQLVDIYNYMLEDNSLNNQNSNNNVHNVTLSEDEKIELAKIEENILGLEYKYFDSRDNELHEDSLALEMLNSLVRRVDNNVNFEAPLLWRDENVVLPTEKSFKIALRRLLIVEKSSIRNGRFNECVEQVDNLLAKNYAEIVPSDEIVKKGNKTFYIPTFFIQPKNKRTRFIWDAATKVDGKSLNDYLMAGPNLYTNYLDIIFRMQEGKFLIKGDLQEMFHQIWMRQEDRDSLRFLFRRSPEEKIQVLRMRVMIFGSKCSPSTSQFVKNKIANNFLETHPDAADVILHGTFVDDVVTSTDDLVHAKSLIKDIRDIMKSGGFNLVKLKSNNDEVFESIRRNLTTDDLQNKKLFSEEKEEKLLGYVINFETDEIAIALTLEKIPENILNCEVKPTKKQILQLLMSIYDPIGFIEFLLSKFKLIYHELIKRNYEWSQVIDDTIFVKWKKCISWLKEINLIKIPRLYSQELSNAAIVQLVGFGDAGIDMVCNVIYLRLLDRERNQLDYRFVCAKSYIVPFKQARTIPELEVDVASKLAVLMDKVEKSHKIKFNEKLYFTDNIAVREWIVNDAKNPKVYVKNRLNKIKQFTKSEEWHWIPTDFQPADFGTKMSAMPEISYVNDWFHPRIFQLPEGNWPKITANIESNFSHNSDSETFEGEFLKSIIERFSSFDKLVKCMIKVFEWKSRAKILKISNNIKALKSENPRTRSATSELKTKIEDLTKEKIKILKDVENQNENYTHVESILIICAQKEVFHDEYQIISSSKCLKKSNLLYKLFPYIDQRGILRAQSRITNNDINREKFTLDRINPIILPRTHHLTKLIILKHHNAQAHHNEKTVVINLLSRFYIHKVKRTVNNVIRKDCIKCKISHAKPDAPLMRDIPSYRLAFHLPAFSYVIVDLLGPIQVKALRNVINKRYILVYSCLTTRALHLEIIEGLDSHATLRALQNTFNLRGVPIRICSDNGTNFTGGSKILKECHIQWNDELIKRGAITHPIEWDFSPAKAPHMNGSVERIVGLVKIALKNIKIYLDMKSSLYDDFGLRTVICEIINMINSRPIEIMPNYEGQNSFLTPNFFIMGRQNAQSLPPKSILPKSFTQQWHDIKIITNILWQKWLKAYFPLMMEREKWLIKVDPLKIGDIIITADPNIANSWRIGVIEKVVMGSQQQVREVIVRLGKNKSMQNLSLKSRNFILKSYKDEVDTVVSRPAIAVAKIKFD